MQYPRSQIEEWAAKYREYLRALFPQLCSKLINKDIEYGGSWIRRGGSNAWHMLCRKWDRIEIQVDRHNEDIIKALAADTREEGLEDDIEDLIGYLSLALAHYRANIKKTILVEPETPEEVRVVPRHIESQGIDGMAYPRGYDEQQEIKDAT